MKYLKELIQGAFLFSGKNETGSQRRLLCSILVLCFDEFYSLCHARIEFAAVYAVDSGRYDEYADEYFAGNLYGSGKFYRWILFIRSPLD